MKTGESQKGSPISSLLLSVVKALGIVAAIVVFLIVAIVGYIGYVTPVSKDYDDAKVVGNAVKEEFPFRAINEPKLGPTIYFSPGRFYTHMIIYGISARPDQDRIIELVRQARANGPKKRVEITFKDAERFIGAKPGEPGIGERSGELVLREVTVGDQR